MRYGVFSFQKIAKKIAEKCEEDEDFMARIKANYVGNLKRHLELDGTLEPTEGTVKTFKSYPEDDPVVVFVTARDDDNWLSGKDWDCEQDCTYLREAMDGCGKTFTFVELNTVNIDHFGITAGLTEYMHSVCLGG